MKFMTIPLAAMSLLMAGAADAQSLQAQADSPGMNDAPRTKRERDLGLEGKPRGQKELSGPDDDGYSTEEPDYDDDDPDEVLPASPGSAPQRL